jgi:hypothetical protein
LKEYAKKRSLILEGDQLMWIRSSSLEEASRLVKNNQHNCCLYGGYEKDGTINLGRLNHLCLESKLYTYEIS